MKVDRLSWDGIDPATFAARLRERAPTLEQVTEDVRAIVSRVREGGDEALRAVAESLGDVVPAELEVSAEAIAAAPGLLEPEVREALRVSARNIEAVARAELEQALRPAAVELEEGHSVRVVTEPVAVAGVYAPGGRGAYPSSVLMTAIPARVAGVRRVVIATPPAASGRPSPEVLAACAIAGVDHVFAIGGPQAIAALAYGTETVPAVDVIAGPGNRWVTEAKRLVSGRCGIDGIAGPSEVMIVADLTAHPEWVALDLCAQAEHGADGIGVVVSPDAALLDRVEELVVAAASERASIAEGASVALVETPGREVALALADAFAPEHLELAYAGVDAAAAAARVAGCVFVGEAGATAFGDYAAGSNHVLPTGGAARFGGPLGPRTFMRRTSVVEMPASAAARLAPHVSVLAAAEGFPVHGESAVARDGDPMEQS